MRSCEELCPCCMATMLMSFVVRRRSWLCRQVHKAGKNMACKGIILLESSHATSQLETSHKSCRSYMLRQGQFHQNTDTAVTLWI